MSLYTSSVYISSLLEIGSLLHLGIFYLRDVNCFLFLGYSVFNVILFHKFSIVSYLSWITLFLGFLYTRYLYS